MNIELKIYYIDEKDKFYCFSCAIKEIENKINTEIESKDTYNMPQCCKCGKFL